MGRPRRLHVPKTVSHVMGRGNAGQPIFDSDEDRLGFLGILEEVTRRCGFLVLAYCLMSNHFHLLLETGLVPIGDVMRRVLCRYARRYNRANKRLGHLFQSRFKAKLCVDEAYFVTALRYIHQNPVKAGLVDAPGDWVWSSHRQFVRGPRSALLSLDRTLGLLSDDRTLARERYLRLMQEESDFTPCFDPSPAPKPEPSQCLPSLDQLAELVPLTNRIQDAPGIRPRSVSRFRRAFAAIAAEHGYGGSAIAGFLKVTPAAVTRYLKEAR